MFGYTFRDLPNENMGCTCNPWKAPKRGVKAEQKIDGGRRQSRASGDRLFYAKRAEGLPPKRQSYEQTWEETIIPTKSRDFRRTNLF